MINNLVLPIWNKDIYEKISHYSRKPLINFENAKTLIEGGEVDGLLVGRDSLKTNNFIELVKQIDKIS